MDVNTFKKIGIIQEYVVETFTHGDWKNLGILTNSENTIKEHPRLFRSLAFGDDDYETWVHEVINKICHDNENNIEKIIEVYDIDLWFKQKDLARYEKIFLGEKSIQPSFWKSGHLKVFISHLASGKNRANRLKHYLANFGFSCFVAHEDIEPTREWMTEIESALNTMDLMIAIIEPGFKQSNWTDQEIGFALCKGVEIIPLRAGADPHGFLGKYQGIQAIGKIVQDVGNNILEVVLKKPKNREKVINGIRLSISKITEEKKVLILKELDKLDLLEKNQMGVIIESAGLEESSKNKIHSIVEKYSIESEASVPSPPDDDLPF